MKHFLIIGGGIIGMTLARELLINKRGEVTVLEKENCFGAHQSGRNSSVVHSGINQKPGSMKARMCIQGNLLLREYCKEKKISLNECGTLVVARSSRELKVLENLMDLGRCCEVPGLIFLTAEEIRRKEPKAKGIKALFSPTGAVVDMAQLLERLAEDIRHLGAKVFLNEKVIDINPSSSRVQTEKNFYYADHIINCAGLYADKIAHKMGEGKEYSIFPFRGEYMEVEGVEVNTMIYQPPDLRFPFLSVHLTRETDGKVLAGPTAVLSFGRESYHKEFHFKETFEMLTKLRFYLLATKPSFFSMAKKALSMSFSSQVFKKEIEDLVGPIHMDQIKPYRSGIRAQMVDSKGNFIDDLLVVFKPNATHVLNCVSPGMTCSFAFAKYLDQKIASLL